MESPLPTSASPILSHISFLSLVSPLSPFLFLCHYMYVSVSEFQINKIYKQVLKCRRGVTCHSSGVSEVGLPMHRVSRPKTNGSTKPRAKG